jgi:putative oxidoreductase
MIDRSSAPYGILLLRVSLGVLFIAHAAAKIFVYTIPGTIQYFQSLGLPAVMAYAAIALELLGGIALVIGLYAPYVALPLAIHMLATIVFEHGKRGWAFSNEGGGWEYPAFWAVTLIVLYLLGDGAHAVKPAFGDDRPHAR